MDMGKEMRVIEVEPVEIAIPARTDPVWTAADAGPERDEAAIEMS